MLFHGTDIQDIESNMGSPSTNGSKLKNGRSARSSSSRSPLPPTASSTPDNKTDMDTNEEKVGGDIIVSHEPGRPPKLSRTASQKVISKPPQLFSHLPDSTDEALKEFEQIKECDYANKYMGFSEHAMGCDCAEEWDPESGRNLACGEDSDCINRATGIECTGDSGCGPNCQNQRFQKKKYAPVAVIKTEKKGYGLRAEVNLHTNQLVYEYVGEVVGEAQFRRRRRSYDEQNIKHFYFMSLNKGEFIDATKRGNLGRFCNHSCNPNCYVDKWVVGEKVRMGIFAKRAVQAGEELVFDYNVDRYGADPQVCYCDEPNCTGYIGGRTQTERATKLSNVTIEALGIDDADAWDTVVARRPKKKKTGEDDEEYVDSVQPKSLDEGGVTKVMAALMQCQEKWIAVKLLNRIQRCDDERVRNRVVKMHGYQILSSQLSMWKDDHNVILQILDILDSFPRLTRNKINDSKIEDNIRPLTTMTDSASSEVERVAKKAAALLASWANLEVGYRIPRMKRGEQAKQARNQFERREAGREQQQQHQSPTSPPRQPRQPRQPSHDAQKKPIQAKGPWGLREAKEAHQRDAHNRAGLPYIKCHREEIQATLPLPPGWFTSECPYTGRPFYYTFDHQVQWLRPQFPAEAMELDSIPEDKKGAQVIIDRILNKQDTTPSERKSNLTPGSPQSVIDRSDKKKNNDDWWKKLDEQKQRKVYENTLHPHIQSVVDQYKNKIPKDDLKRFAKETAKKLVDGDYKRNRVSNPTVITDKHQRTVKEFCKSFFDKAAKKHKERQKIKAEKSRRGSTVKPDAVSPLNATPVDLGSTPAGQEANLKVTDNEHESLVRTVTPTPAMDNDSLDGDSSLSLKRKRDEDVPTDQDQLTPFEGGSSPFKRQKSTPLSPPPPPAGNPSDTLKEEIEVASAICTPPPPPPPLQDYQNANGNGYADSSPNMEMDMTDLPSHIQVEGQV